MKQIKKISVVLLTACQIINLHAAATATRSILSQVGNKGAQTFSGQMMRSSVPQGASRRSFSSQAEEFGQPVQHLLPGDVQKGQYHYGMTRVPRKHGFTQISMRYGEDGYMTLKAEEVLRRHLLSGEERLGSSFTAGYYPQNGDAAAQSYNRLVHEAQLNNPEFLGQAQDIGILKAQQALNTPQPKEDAFAWLANYLG